MAKVAAKTSAKAPKKTTSSSVKASGNNKIEKVCQDALEKLRAIGIDQQLQQDIEWCLGSYKADSNPVGLYAMAERVLAIFRDEKAKKTKGITAKTITDIEKVIEER
jgi:hypothetical protein